MEFLELKSAWNTLEKEVIGSDKIEKEKISNSIHSKSNSEISSIKNSLHLKFVLASLSIIAAIILASLSFFKPSYNPLDMALSPIESAVFFMFMAISISIMVFFNYKAYKKIKLIEESALNLKDNLESFIDAMNNAIHFNIYSDAFITPIVITFLYYAAAFKNHNLAFDLRSLILFIIPIIVGLISYYTQKYMQQLKFGNYLDRLSHYLKTLEEKSVEM